MSNLKLLRRRLQTDYTFENHLSIWLVRSNNILALEHLQSSVSDEAQWMGEALAVEPRYVEGLAQNLFRDGFNVNI